MVNEKEYIERLKELKQKILLTFPSEDDDENSDYAIALDWAIEYLGKIRKYRKKAKRYKNKWLSLKRSLDITKELTTGKHNTNNDGLYADLPVIDPSYGYYNL